MIWLRAKFKFKQAHMRTIGKMQISVFADTSVLLLGWMTEFLPQTVKKHILKNGYAWEKGKLINKILKNSSKIDSDWPCFDC